MAFGINKTRLTPIAIDFGVDALKLLQISTNGDTTQLVGAASVVIPESARKDGSARYAFLADALKELIRQQPFKGRRAMCAIPAFQTLVNTFELQCNEQDDLDQQVNLHLQTVMDKDPSRMVIRNHRVGAVMRDGTTRQRVICMAANRAVVMRYLEIATAAKLEVVGMHSEPVCIARGFSELYNRRESDKTEARCFIDIGAAATKLVIIRDREILLARNIAVSGDELTRRHMREHKVDFAEARLARMREAKNPLAARPFPSFADKQKSEQIKAAIAGVGGDRSAVASAEQTDEGDQRRERGLVERPAELSELDETLDTLVDDIRLTVRYHNAVKADASVKRVVLLGGEAHQRVIAEAIAHAFGVPTYVGDPLARVMRTPGLTPVGVDINQPQPGWAVPLGMCFSEANL
jgi:type IV pilus assembly protein PilM